jgi:hypothetical protein
VGIRARWNGSTFRTHRKPALTMRNISGAGVELLDPTYTCHPITDRRIHHTTGQTVARVPQNFPPLSFSCRLLSILLLSFKHLHPCIHASEQFQYLLLHLSGSSLRSGCPDGLRHDEDER